ncbi:hypothetical protein EC973_002179 [Apophysomyces ossiformis]|uniref:Uncharacterized protein n=1 Tax=Apophysomyces ossiformis TaxID=679940 RepID=A0A8H7EMQ2_9FUNG|nr:hypothetical protein EC973_002179 [Apophysomyces ossiformis]
MDKVLLQRIKYVDDLSLRATQALSTALSQARTASERLNEVHNLKSQAQQTNQYAMNIFDVLCQLERHLDPEDRIGHSALAERWPELDQLHQRIIGARPMMNKATRSTLDPPVLSTESVSRYIHPEQDDNGSGSWTEVSEQSTSTWVADRLRTLSDKK